MAHSITPREKCTFGFERNDKKIPSNIKFLCLKSPFQQFKSTYIETRVKQNLTLEEKENVKTAKFFISNPKVTSKNTDGHSPKAADSQGLLSSSK